MTHIATALTVSGAHKSIPSHILLNTLVYKIQFINHIHYTTMNNTVYILFLRFQANISYSVVYSHISLVLTIALYFTNISK